MSVFVLIPAAGMGRRMKASINKQYLPLQDRPILTHTVSLFDRHPRVDHIYVITPLEEIPLCRREVVEPYGFVKVRDVVAGGAERQDSVRNGLRACPAAPEDIVLVHDGVRPLLPSDTIDRVLDRMEEVDACVVAVPVKDTIKEVVDGRIARTPERRFLWQAQTPQAFRYGQLCAAYEQAALDGFAGSDDASLVERLGRPVAIVEGCYRNIKITTPEDLILARAFLENPGDLSP